MNYHTTYRNSRWWIFRAGRLLGGVSAAALRPYVFPLYTPKGTLVLQEAPPDHPHHQGIVAGLNIQGHDLWNAGSFGAPRHVIESFVPLSEQKPELTDAGVALEWAMRWRLESGDELIKETRRVEFSSGENVTLLRWTSRFEAGSSAVELAQTKEAGIGVRVPPHWETALGGSILNSEGRRGEKDCFDRVAPWLAVLSGFGPKAGVAIVPEAGDDCPWFTRDYGLHVYNPLRHRSILLQPGQPLVWRLSVLAFDGHPGVHEISRMVEQTGDVLV